MESEMCDCDHAFEPYHNNSSHSTKCAASECPCQVFHQHRAKGTAALVSAVQMRGTGTGKMWW